MPDRRSMSSSRMVILLTALAFAGFIVWASVAEIDQVSRARAQTQSSA